MDKIQNLDVPVGSSAFQYAAILPDQRQLSVTVVFLPSGNARVLLLYYGTDSCGGRGVDFSSFADASRR